MSRSVYVFDIDGTLADCSHRLHHIEKMPKDWRSFFAAVADDKPIGHMVDACQSLSWRKLVVFVSGRSEECRPATEDWLERHVKLRGPLYMRAEGDYRDDAIIKIEILAQMRSDGYEPAMVFDDRARVVAAWRAAGIPCAQVAAGDF